MDYGPVSVHDKMHAMGLEVVPSIASLARIFREAGVARLEPRKKPRAAWRRFVCPAPADLPPDTIVKKLTSAGVHYLNKVQYMVGAQHRFHQVLGTTNSNKTGDKITITDLEGEILIEHTRPAPGIAYVGNAKPPGPHTNKPRPSPKS